MLGYTDYVWTTHSYFLQWHSHLLMLFLALAVLGFICALLRLGILIDLTTSSDNIKQYVQSEFDQMIKILSQLCHCFEYTTLIYGLWRLQQNTGKNVENLIQSINRVTKPSIINIANRMKSIMHGLICHSSNNKCCYDFFSSILRLTLLFLLASSVIGYIAITITPPILLTVWRNRKQLSHTMSDRLLEVYLRLWPLLLTYLVLLQDLAFCVQR